VRIAVFHNQPSGGARRALYGFSRYLAARHHLDVFTLTSSDQEHFRDEDVADRVVTLDHRPLHPVRFGLYLNDLRRSKDLDRLRRVDAEAAALIDAGGYDVVLVDACRFTFVPYTLRYLRTPSVFYAHTGPVRLEGRVWEPPRTFYGRARRLWHLPFERALEARVLADEIDLARRANVVITNSLHTRRRVLEGYGVHARVCPPGVDLPVLTPSEEGSYVLSVGEVEPRKGFDFLVDALARLPPSERPALHIVANAENRLLRRRLESRARDRGVTLVVRVAPPQAELDREYREARVFVFAAHREALGLAVLEAMAHARPVVAVAEGGVAETVVDGATGYLSERDPAAFSRQLAGLLADGSRRREMGIAGRHEIERRWTWSSRGPALEAELMALVARERPRRTG
jgi:glycosyltransferase involved in cell wall biosynthesis